MATVPFMTKGGAFLDLDMLQSRLWGERGFFRLQLVGVILWGGVAMTAGGWARALKALLTGAMLLAVLVAVFNEQATLYTSGIFADPLDVARSKLMVSRGIILGLALLCLGFGWWARPKAVRRG